ncbi:TPA: hypothetical protein ACNOH1_003998, partial [Providencia rettgeri]
NFLSLLENTISVQAFNKSAHFLKFVKKPFKTITALFARRGKDVQPIELNFVYDKPKCHIGLPIISI